ncbi:hypothetical protein IEQ34_009303 [Dendrobium chrysotoxum]|uniref:Uncharacterized protein n=1 Tax=Dendrobium chrysotoxum TaxID=161865 RepID=A0AAV7H187_DENCH|nr:hypothetical protein IEQ34_009303 [Dendrobium chrysotoxum]
MDSILIGLFLDLGKKAFDVVGFISPRCFSSPKTLTLVLLGVSLSLVGELEDEHLAGTCEDHWYLSGDHLHVLVSFHYLLDAS